MASSNKIKIYGNYRLFIFTCLFILITAATAGCTQIYEKQPEINTSISEEEIFGDISSDTPPEVKSSPEEKTDANTYNSNSDSSGIFLSYPKLVPKQVTGPKSSVRTFTTKFEKTEYTVSFDINMSVLSGAQTADKSLGNQIRKEPEDVQIQYYRSFFEGEANDAFFDEITKKLRHVKIANGLSDQEYLEYLITFVQQIPYDFLADETRYPIEVLFDRTGDCDEKSMLLIGLLDKSGYDTALILFPDKGHAVSGIKIIPEGQTNFRLYRSDDRRNYLFIEATAPYYIGLYPDDYENANSVVIPVSDKSKMAYTKYNYVAYIVDSMKKIRARIIFLEEDLKRQYNMIKALEEKLNDPYSYYTYQNEFDSDYIDYRQMVDKYNEYYEIYQKNIEVYRHIEQHPYDIEGVRRTIFNSKINEMEY